MPSIRNRLALLVPLLALGGCELLQPPGEDPVLAKLDELERRMQAIERVVQNQSLVPLRPMYQRRRRRSPSSALRVRRLV